MLRLRVKLLFMNAFASTYYNRPNKSIPFQSVLATQTLIVLFTFFAVGCGENVNKISESKVFRYNEDVSVNTLDPVYIKSQSEIWIGSQIYEGLVSLNDALLPTPQIAKSWEITDSGRVYKFVVNRNLNFISTTTDKNGTTPVTKQAVTVRDIAYSLYRLLDPKTASPGAWILNDKMGFPVDYNYDMESPYEHLRKREESPIYTPNDSTVIIRLNRPFPAFLSLLATNFAWITPYKSTNLGLQPIGSGPFYLRRWESDVKMVLLKNPDYPLWEGNQQLPYMQAVNIGFVKSKQTAFMQFMIGESDFFNGVEASFIDELLTDSATLNPKYQHRIQALLTDFLNTEYIGFHLGDSLNGGLNPYLDIHLRKALQLGMDRQGLLRYLRNGLGVPGGNGFVPPALLYTASPENKAIKTPNLELQTGYNVKEARAHLEKSSWFKNPKQYAPLVLTTTNDYLDMAVFLQNSWKQLGIPIAIEIQTGGMLRQLRNSGKLGMFRGSWIADYPDAENYLACFYGKYKAPNGPNYTQFESAVFDSLFEKIAFSPFLDAEAQARRQELVIKANNITQEMAPVMVLYYDKSVRLMQTNIGGLGNDPINRLDLRRVRKR